MTMLNQGQEANNSRAFLETAIEREFIARGVLVRDWRNGSGNGDLFAPKVLWRRRPYKSIYGCDSVGEFVYHDFRFHEIRVECRWQQCAGSVDEKLPYFIWNARDAMPESEIWLVLDGGGARDAAVKWAKQQADNITSKTIRIISLAEVRPLIKQTVARSAA